MIPVFAAPTFVFYASAQNSVAPISSVSVFTAGERAEIQTFWNAPGRMMVAPPEDAIKNGFWQVRLTPDGSAWFLKYQIAIGRASAPPTESPAVAAPIAGSAASPVAIWKAWVERKLAFDRDQAQEICEAANRVAHPMLPLSKRERIAPPGPIPPDLLAACGDPPPFASAIVPLTTTVTFLDGQAFAYTDNVRVGSPSFAYYRFPQGTMALGATLRNMTDAELGPLFFAAGFAPSEQRIASAVSRLEGGFESVNTYDTGFVSIGFLQFITAGDGRGSLLEVLQREKGDNVASFNADFHAFGVDVTSEGALSVVDPATGAELTGAEAVQKTIADKRLSAIWQRAGRNSFAFRVAQIKVAKAHYWPADDPVSVIVNGQTLTGKVSDVIRSEAGMATLFDRKVNRGTIAPFGDALAKVMIARQLKTLVEAAAFERDIVIACRYRTDFLADKTLSQPPEITH